MNRLAISLLTGVAAHPSLSQPSLAAAGAGLALGAYAHARGWPVPVGGSRRTARPAHSGSCAASNRRTVESSMATSSACIPLIGQHRSTDE